MGGVGSCQRTQTDQLVCRTSALVGRCGDDRYLTNSQSQRESFQYFKRLLVMLALVFVFVFVFGCYLLFKLSEFAQIKP